MNTTKTALIDSIAAKAAARERFLLAGLDDKGRALLAARDAAAAANLAALRAFRASDRGEAAKAAARAVHRAERAATDAWSQYLLETQATRVRRAHALGVYPPA